MLVACVPSSSCSSLSATRLTGPSRSRSRFSRSRRVDSASAAATSSLAKPTPLRWELYPAMMAVNAAVKGHVGVGGFDFLDAGGALLTAEGRPDATYFAPDGLHMNARGYAVWNHMVEAYLGGEVKRPTLS